MPDYLARVAAAGMRTSIPARPPVSGPPLLPGQRPSFFAFAPPTVDVEQVEGEAVQGEVSTERVVPALPAATVAVKKQIPLTTGVEQVEGEDVQGEVSPERVVPALPAATVAVKKQVPLTTGVEQVEGEDVQGEVSPERVVPALPAATVAVKKQVPPKAVGRTQLQQQAPPIATSTIRAPKALRPAKAPGSVPSPVSQEVIHSDRKATPNSLADTAMSSPAAPLPVAPGVKEAIAQRPTMSGESSSSRAIEGRDTPSMVTVNPEFQSRIAQAADKVTKGREQSVLPPQGLLKQVATPPMPSAQVSAPPLPPAHPTSRQVKLTIGRLDVQVNNRQPAPPTRRAAPAASSAATDGLEQRYVDRFRLKP
jgi:hypothetical protein